MQLYQLKGNLYCGVKNTLPLTSTLSILSLPQSSYFSRDDQALPGFAAHFAKESEEEREHGMKLMAYQSKRGGRCVFQDIAKPVSREMQTIQQGKFHQ